MEIPYTLTARPDTGLYNGKLGIWLFLASEVMLFGALFTSYLFMRLGAEDGIELIRRAVEDMLDIRGGKMARGDAVVAAQDALQDEHRALLEPLAHVGALHDLPAFGLREGGGRDGGGEGVEMHSVKGGRGGAKWTGWRQRRTATIR